MAAVELWLAFGGGVALNISQSLRVQAKSLVPQHLIPVKDNLCEQLLYSLYCPSSNYNDPECICAHCQKVCTTKSLLKATFETFVTFESN